MKEEIQKSHLLSRLSRPYLVSARKRFSSIQIKVLGINLFRIMRGEC